MTRAIASNRPPRHLPRSFISLVLLFIVIVKTFLYLGRELYHVPIALFIKFVRAAALKTEFVYKTFKLQL